jgi:hypothetical protein
VSEFEVLRRVSVYSSAWIESLNARAVAERGLSTSDGECWSRGMVAEMPAVLYARILRIDRKQYFPMTTDKEGGDERIHFVRKDHL